MRFINTVPARLSFETKLPRWDETKLDDKRDKRFIFNGVGKRFIL